MNYGYFRNDFKPQLSQEDEKERFPIHLYHYLCSKSSINNVRVLEVGCGMGTEAINFYAQGANYTGTDLSEESLALAKKRFKVYHGMIGRIRLMRK